ncbi:hypothetical protein V6R85_24010 [Agrobacterium sp. CCNWLW32]|uniref:hypothetical protein n=1 Tax=Agrobacterium sp. CCNWLW32 TaxID=3122072 RepID=UPI00300F8583
MLKVHWYSRPTFGGQDPAYFFHPQWDRSHNADARSWAVIQLAAIGWIRQDSGFFHFIDERGKQDEETPEEIIREADRILTEGFGDLYHQIAVPTILRAFVMFFWQQPRENGHVGLKVSTNQLTPEFKAKQLDAIFEKLGGVRDEEGVIWFPFTGTAHVSQRVREQGFSISESAPKGLLFEWLGGSAPVQARGWINASPFYFRAEGNCWQLNVGGSDPFRSPEWIYSEAYEGADEMPLEEAEVIIRSTIGRYERGEAPKPFGGDR